MCYEIYGELKNLNRWIMDKWIMNGQVSDGHDLLIGWIRCKWGREGIRSGVCLASTLKWNHVTVAALIIGHDGPHPINLPKSHPIRRTDVSKCSQLHPQQSSFFIFSYFDEINFNCIEWIKMAAAVFFIRSFNLFPTLSCRFFVFLEHFFKGNTS